MPPRVAIIAYQMRVLLECWIGMGRKHLTVRVNIDRHGFRDRDYEICGVIEDIQNRSLQNESFPAVYYLEPELRVFMVRLKPGDIRKTVAEMEAA